MLECVAMDSWIAAFRSPFAPPFTRKIRVYGIAQLDRLAQRQTGKEVHRVAGAHAGDDAAVQVVAMRIHRCKSARSHTVFCHGFAHSVQFAHAGQVDAVKGLALQFRLFAALVGVGRCKLQGVRFQLLFTSSAFSLLSMPLITAACTFLILPRGMSLKIPQACRLP